MALYPRLTACAACVVLEPAGQEGDMPVIVTAGVPGFEERTGGNGQVFIGPGEAAAPGDRVIDLEGRGVGGYGVGGYGALGVLGVAVAAAMAVDATVVCGDQTDGWRIAVIRGDRGR
jgi:hypothetical protein